MEITQLKKKQRKGLIQNKEFEKELFDYATSIHRETKDRESDDKGSRMELEKR